jgi:hypothetical protein
MTLSIRRGALALAIAALSAAAALPAAEAAPPVVCNQASPHWLGGGLVALDPPVTSPAARYTVDIGKLPSNAAGLLTAAANSPSLTVCAPAPTDTGGGIDINVVVTDPATDASAGVGDGVISIS